MKTGEFIYAQTNADFLNKAFGTNYRGYQKSSWKYSDDWVVWMVEFNKVKNGWTNTFVNNSRIKQDNLLRREEFEGQPINMVTTKKRIVFEIDNSGYLRKYIFRGMFVYDEINSNAITSQYLDKIADEL